jgi:hypothetical protein
VPSAASFSSPGTFRQGMQTGSWPGSAGGIAGGISPINSPDRASLSGSRLLACLGQPRRHQSAMHLSRSA